MSCTKREVAMRLAHESYGARYARRTSRGIGVTTPMRAAPPANALRPRISPVPSAESRPSLNRFGNGLPAGNGNAAVLVITSRRICAACVSPQPNPIAPPQSCTASVTGPVMPRCCSSRSTSSTRDCSV